MVSHEAEPHLCSRRAFALPPHEVVKMALDDLSRLGSPSLTAERMTTFAQTHVAIIRQAESADIAIIDQDYAKFDGSLDPALLAYLHSPRTKTVVAEYFIPEVTYNLRTALKIPGFGQLTGYLWKRQQEMGRFRFALELSQQCKQAKKPISVADIDNKLTYELLYILHPTLLSEAPLVLTNASIGGFIVSALIFGKYSFLRTAEVIVPHFVFSEKKVYGLEKIVVDTEDARRVYVAAGVRQLAHEYKKTRQDKEIPQIVVIYPRAHALRIAHYLLDPTRIDEISRRIKQIAYRFFPNLDFNVRTYQWKDTLAKITGQPLEYWQLVSNRSISFFS